MAIKNWFDVILSMFPLHFSDWRFLTQAQQTETKEFLLMKFGIDDLKLALDHYITQNGKCSLISIMLNLLKLSFI